MLSLLQGAKSTKMHKPVVCHSQSEFFDSQPRSDKQQDSADPSKAAPGNGKMPEWRWWTGLVCYAVTNVGFMKLFDFCAGCPDYLVVFQAMGTYYAIALLLRLIMRKVFGLDKSFPQFFWEGLPTRGDEK